MGLSLSHFLLLLVLPLPLAPKRCSPTGGGWSLSGTMCAVRTKLAGRGAGKGARRSRHRMITQRDATLPGVRGGQASTGRARGENPLPWPDPCPTLCPVPGGGAEASSWPVGLPSSWTAPAGSAAAHAHGSSASGPACTGPQPGPRGFWPDRRPTEEGLADSRGAPALAGAPPSLHRAIRADCRPLPPARPQGLTGPRPAPRGGGRSLGAGVCASGAWRARQLPPQPLLPERRPPPPPYRGAAPAGPRPAPAIGSAAPGAASPPGAAATPLRALSSALAVPRLCLPLAPAPRLSRASRCRPPRQPGPRRRRRGLEHSRVGKGRLRRQKPDGPPQHIPWAGPSSG